MKVLCGTLMERLYEGTSPPVYKGDRELTEGMIGYKEGCQTLHEIEALADSVSLHIYSPGGYAPRCYGSSKPCQSI